MANLIAERVGRRQLLRDRIDVIGLDGRRLKVRPEGVHTYLPTMSSRRQALEIMRRRMQYIRCIAALRGIRISVSQSTKHFIHAGIQLQLNSDLKSPTQTNMTS